MAEKKWIVIRLNTGNSSKEQFLQTTLNLVKHYIASDLAPVLLCPVPRDILDILLDILTVTASRNYEELIQQVQKEFHRICIDVGEDPSSIQEAVDIISSFLKKAHTEQMTGFQMAKNDATVVALSQVLISKLVFNYLNRNGIPAR
jgi:hypothetical protein